MVRSDGPTGDAASGTAAERAETPDFPAARQHLLTELVRFVAVLRTDGVSVPASGTLDAARALASVGLDDEDRVDAALRASLLSNPADSDAFEEAFPTFWHRLRGGFDRIATAHDGPSPDGDEGEDGKMERPSDGDDASESGGDTDDSDLLADAEPPEMTDDGDGDDPTVRIPTDRRHAVGDRPTGEEDTDADGRRYSAVGESELVDPDAPTPSSAESADIARFVDALATLPGRRRHRSATGSAVDARAALRASLQTGGAPLNLPRTAPTPSELRCCLLVDVSGSVLDTIDRSAVLGLAGRLATDARESRVFLFDTDLIDATDAFTDPDRSPADALRAAEIEWGGGTRIGHAFDELRRTAPHAIDRRTVVIVVSDGLDVGDPDLLIDGVTWLADRSNCVVWLNPLAVSAAFEPASRGMAAAAPYVDALFGFAEAADLAEAARQIERHGVSGSVGYEHDGRHADAATDGGDPA